jgi:hypothetical protein
MKSRDATASYIQSLLFDVDSACKYFAIASLDPTYDDEANVVKFSKLPIH